MKSEIHRFRAQSIDKVERKVINYCRKNNIKRISYFKYTLHDGEKVSYVCVFKPEDDETNTTLFKEDKR